MLLSAAKILETQKGPEAKKRFKKICDEWGSTVDMSVFLAYEAGTTEKSAPPVD